MSDDQKKNLELQQKRAGTQINENAVQDNNEGYWWVMNYLAGDDNTNKRPYQFIMKGFDRGAGDMQRPEWYTDKIKFWKIVWHMPAVAWGDWREAYRRSKIDKAKSVNSWLAAKASAMLDKGKIDFFDGLRSTVDYPTWASQEIKYVRYENNNVLKAGTATLVDLVEGADKNHPGLAVRYGFMNASNINKPPAYVMNLWR